VFFSFVLNIAISLYWAHCDGRVDFIDWAGGDTGSGMLPELGTVRNDNKIRYVTKASFPQKKIFE
jgi:hypothetical protein